MATVTLDNLKQRARVQADQENSTFFGDTDLTDKINASCQELYDLLVAAFEDYYLTQYDSTTVAGTDSYNLPNDFYKLIGADMQDTSSYWRELLPFAVRQRNTMRNAAPGGQPRYWIKPTQIQFLPVPADARPFRLYYIPTMTKLVAGGSTFDGVNGWEEYVVQDVAAQMLIKEESDPSACLAKKAELKERIQSMTKNRNAGVPRNIVDVYESESEDW